ncbi:MAG: DUF6263 family protein [Bacteroidales bacterium]|nr:DUF6263 family protein [Bacteroidales bacterium]
MKKLITLLGIFTVCALQAQTVSLKLQLKEGQTYTMQIEQHVETEQSAMGQTVKANVLLQMTNLYKVAGKQDGQWVIEAQYRHVYCQAETPMGKETFGSELKDDLSLGAKALINKPYTMLITEEGKVTAVKGLEKIFEEMDTELASMSRGRRRTVIDRMKAAFSEEVSKTFMESCFIKDPGRELRAGLVWMRRDTTSANGIEMFQDDQYRIDSFDEQAISVSVRGTISTNPNAKPIIANGAETKTQLYGSGSGKYTIDPRTGWVKELEATNDMSGNVSIRMGGQSMDVPLKMKLKTAIKNISE